MEGPLVISNTTPLINFSEIGHLDLLDSLFGTVVVTPSVKAEALAKSNPFPHTAAAVLGDRFPSISPSDQLLVGALSSSVHAGEAECIALAMERPGSLLLLDDLAARELAALNGCRFVGTIGILVEAKKQGLVPAVAPLFQELRRKARFWLSDALIYRTLRDAGES